MSYLPPEAANWRVTLSEVIPEVHPGGYMPLKLKAVPSQEEPGVIALVFYSAGPDLDYSEVHLAFLTTPTDLQGFANIVTECALL